MLLQGFSLQLGSELYLVFDVAHRHQLADLTEKIAGTVRIIATFSVDNGTVQSSDTIGMYSFTDASPGIKKFVVDGKSPSFIIFNPPNPISRTCREIRLLPPGRSSLVPPPIPILGAIHHSTYVLCHILAREPPAV